MVVVECITVYVKGICFSSMLINREILKSSDKVLKSWILHTKLFLQNNEDKFEVSI